MPSIFELFGFPIDDTSEIAQTTRKSAWCPFMDTRCDGGGNRNQTKLTLSDKDVELVSFFDKEVLTVIPGICSIISGGDTWIVCPRRIFAARNPLSTLPPVNKALQKHEKMVLSKTNLPTDSSIGIWSEVYIRQRIDDADVNYHFDYIAAPLKPFTLRRFLEQFVMTEEQLAQEVISFSTHMKKKGYYKPGQRMVADIEVLLPDLQSPCILEVMTASTSGSDTENGTDIRNAFRNAILQRPHQSPGINKRQVWGRMVTQLFAKTALAHAWEGQTIWIIQDELLHNIELTTLLKTSKIGSRPGGDINLIIMNYDGQAQSSNVLVLKDWLVGDSGLDFDGDDTFTDILLPKIIPPKLELARAILRRSIDAIVQL